MSQPELLVLAAGIGSRYGGLKQIDSIGPHGEVIMDYSIFDALRAGFENVVFVIREEIEEVFEKKVGNNLKQYIDTAYAHQTLDHLPDGYSVPDNRKRPWGTAHAVLCAREQLDGPFAVINADDFYGQDAFHQLYEFLSNQEGEQDPDQKEQYCMVGYDLKNTLSSHGHVSRGICQVDENQKLQNIVERKKIKQFNDGIKYCTEDGQWKPLEPDATVSMNMWGFTQSIFSALQNRFSDFLDQHATDPSAEYLLRTVVNALIEEDRAEVTVKPTDEEWFGVTFKEDREEAEQAVQNLIEEGEYPEKLWD